MSRANREAAQEVVRADQKLGPGPKLLLLSIGDLVADGRLLEAGCDFLADLIGSPRSSVQRWRAELVEAGHLIGERLVDGGQQGNTYRLGFPTAHLRAVQPPTYRPPTGGSTAHLPPTHGREQEQGSNRNPSSTNPSPPRNDPTTCTHQAIDDTGYCAACSTQVRAS